jgi:HlyD family secretion protein
MANGNNGATNGITGRRWAVIAGVVFLLIVIAGIVQLVRPLRIRVTTTVPAREDIVSTISTNGKVEPIQNFDGFAPLPTTVRAVYVKEGDKVHKGQLLIQLDDSDARKELTRALAALRGAESGTADVQVQNATSEADLEKAQTEHDQATRNFQAIQRLVEHGAASQAELSAAQDRVNRANADLAVLQRRAGAQAVQNRDASAQANVANARASVDAARHMVEDCRIVAPFEGTVYALAVRPGFFTNTGQLLVQEADLSRVQVRGFVDEPEIGHLKLGEVVHIGWDALPGRTWQGSVTTLPSTVVNRGNRVVGEVLISVNNGDRALLPNINVTVTIITSSHNNALVLPREAVHEEDGKNFIYVIKPNNHLERREVQLGVANLTQVEILKGLSQSETVAVNSVSPTPLRDGVLVKVVEPQS